MDWSGIAAGIGGMLAGVGRFVLQLIVFAVILLIGWLIAKSIAKGLEFLLRKIGFQKVLDKAGISRLLAPTGIDPLGLAVKLVYYFVLLIALLLALGAFGQDNPVSQVVTSIIEWLPRVFVAIVIVIVVSAIANFVGDLMGPALSRFRFGRILTRIVVFAIIALGVIAALNQIGVALTVTTPVLVAVLATIAGVVIVGVGGGLIGPMRERWEKWLGALESEISTTSATTPPVTRRAAEAGTTATAPTATATTPPGTTPTGTTGAATRPPEPPAPPVA